MTEAKPGKAQMYGKAALGVVLTSGEFETAFGRSRWVWTAFWQDEKMENWATKGNSGKHMLGLGRGVHSASRFIGSVPGQEGPLVQKQMQERNKIEKVILQECRK